MVQAAHVLVGGGTGFVGRHLVQCLKSNGAKVRVITRKPANKADYVSWVSLVQKFHTSSSVEMSQEKKATVNSHLNFV